MSVDQVFVAIIQAARERAYLERVEITEQSKSLLKARLYVSPGVFVQIYRNDRFETTSFALIYNEKRIFGRDYLNGSWHRHPMESPDTHDRSIEGQRSVDLPSFLDEVERVLTALDLP